MPINPIAPVQTEVSDYPKVLYRSDTTFIDEDALKQGLSPGGAVKMRTVADADDEAAAVEAGWTLTPLDFVGAAPAARRTKKDATA